MSRAKLLASVYATAAFLFLPFSLALASRNLDLFWQYGNFGASAGSLFHPVRLEHNLSFLLEALISYHGLAFLSISVAACLLAVLVKPRIMLAILAGAIGYSAAIVWFSNDQLFGRFFIPIVPLYNVGVSIAISTLARSIRVRFNIHSWPIIIACLALWVYTVSLPLLNALYVAPSSANIFRLDKSEYIRNSSSGYGIPELAKYLVEQTEGEQPYVVGAFVGCETLRLYLTTPAQILLDCPNVLAGGRRAKYLNSYLPGMAEEDGRFLLVLETSGYVSPEELTDIQLTLLAVFPRSGNQSVIQLYSADVASET